MVEIAILMAGSGKVLWRWSFLKQWTSPDASKMNDRDLVMCFNVILYYVEVSIVKGFYINEILSLSLKKKNLGFPSSVHITIGKCGYSTKLVCLKGHFWASLSFTAG